MSTFLEAIMGQTETEASASTDAKVDVQSDIGTEQVEVPNEVAETKADAKADAKIEPLSEDAVIARLTGGKVETVKDFEENFPKWQEAISRDLDSIRSEAFVNPFVKQINDLVAKKAPVEQLKQFIELSQLDDMAKLDDAEALAIEMSIKEGITLSQARKFVKSDLKTAEDFVDEYDDDDKAEIAYQKYEHEISKKAKEAKEFLQSHRKGIYDNVFSEDEKVAKAQERMQTLHSDWSSELNALGDIILGNGAKIEVKDEKGGIDYSFDVNIPKEFLDTVINQIPDFASKRGMDMTKENIQAIAGEVFKTYISSNFDTIAESIIRDSYAKGVKSAMEEQSNPYRTGRVQTTPKSSLDKDDPMHPENFYR